MVEEIDPIEQGLKPQTRSALGLPLEVEEIDPIEQGLKLSCKIKIRDLVPS